ncbi:suppressor of cytokine signaling 5-like [Tubulanus polymorphus]|uniref:suppressor of cytokine signaling 5-like n=1 Tax=Tubulanus polymorphus TaxID=672921 RepID=UPI003DA48AD8
MSTNKPEKDPDSGSSIDSLRDQIISRRMFADIDEESSAGDEASNSDDNAIASETRSKKMYRFTMSQKRKKNRGEIKEKKSSSNSSSGSGGRKYWFSFKFRKRWTNRLRRSSGSKSAPCDLASADSQLSLDAGCVSTCMGIKKVDEHFPGSGILFTATSSDALESRSSDEESPVHTPKVKLKKASKMKKSKSKSKASTSRLLEIANCPADDSSDHLCAVRARDLENGVEIPPNIPYHSALAGAHDSSLGSAFQRQCVMTTTYPNNGSPLHGAAYSSESQISEYGSLTPQGTYIPHTVHTQVDYIHCLVPDLQNISSCSFYWGVMDRYEAEKLLENKPEGTFLLRDSAQEEFLFSVSFRRYARSLHARIEQWNHKFSFDSHDPGVFSSDTVCELIEHYKDPSCCMFFEPMLTLPMNRTFPFPLQHLCRAVIGTHITYDAINFLPLPKKLKEYLKYYHYKQKVRVRRFEVHS